MGARDGCAGCPTSPSYPRVRSGESAPARRAHRGGPSLRSLPARAGLVGPALQRRRQPNLGDRSRRRRRRAPTCCSPITRTSGVPAPCCARCCPGTASVGGARSARHRRAGTDPPVGVRPRQRRGLGRPALAGDARGDRGAPARHPLGGRRRAAQRQSPTGAFPPLCATAPRPAGIPRASPAAAPSACWTPASARPRPQLRDRPGWPRSSARSRSPRRAPPAASG
jgi:hypothetical protein